MKFLRFITILASKIDISVQTHPIEYLEIEQMDVDEHENSDKTEEVIEDFEKEIYASNEDQEMDEANDDNLEYEDNLDDSDYENDESIEFDEDLNSSSSSNDLKLPTFAQECNRFVLKNT